MNKKVHKKNVLIFIPKFPVRTQTFIKREMEELVCGDDFDITIVSLASGEGKLSKKCEDKTCYIRLGIFGLLFGFLSFLFSRPRRLFKSLRVVGWDHFNTFIKGVGYAKKFLNYDPDIIYAHFLSKPSSIALVASIILGVDFAISAHARDILEYPDLVGQKIKRSKFITICNKNAYEKVKSLGRDRDISDLDNIKLIYHGLSQDDLKIKEGVKKSKPPLIFCVGRYVEKKGLKYLVRSAKILKDKKVSFKMVIAGGGPLEKKLKEVVEDLGLQDEVFLAGSISFDEVKRYYHKSSVFAYPGVNAFSGDADGIPNTLIEAAMLKIPIVTTNSGSILDFLDKDTAKIVPQGDSGALADGILEVLVNKGSENMVLVNNAFKKATEMFDLKRNVGEIKKLF